MRSVLQTKEWAEFKTSQGFSAKGGPASGWEILKIDNIFVHKRLLPLGQNFLYVPEVSPDDITPTQIDQLKSLAKEQKSIFARLELYGKFSDNAQKLVKSFGFIKAFEQVQPKWRQFVDLTKTTGEILAQMKQKGRYNVKLAERKGVKVLFSSLRATGGSEAIRNERLPRPEGRPRNDMIGIFYSLYEQTFKREGITGRSLAYFQKMLETFNQTDYIRIYTAKLGHEYLCAALIILCGDVATYLYGGSSRRHKEVMAPYLMHWQIMKDAKAAGIKIYDLHGRARPEDEKSSWAGITRFKEQFGGEETELLGSYDYINKSMFYRVFRIAERVRRKQE